MFRVLTNSGLRTSSNEKSNIICNNNNNTNLSNDLPFNSMNVLGISTTTLEKKSLVSPIREFITKPANTAVKLKKKLMHIITFRHLWLLDQLHQSFYQMKVYQQGALIMLLLIR